MRGWAWARKSQGEVPAQFKPYYFRHRMLVNSFEQNYGQARVDAEEMDLSLLLNGSGITLRSVLSVWPSPWPRWAIWLRPNTGAT